MKRLSITRAGKHRCESCAHTVVQCLSRSSRSNYVNCTSCHIGFSTALSAKRSQLQPTSKLATYSKFSRSPEKSMSGTVATGVKAKATATLSPAIAAKTYAVTNNTEKKHLQDSLERFSEQRFPHGARHMPFATEKGMHSYF